MVKKRNIWGWVIFLVFAGLGLAYFSGFQPFSVPSQDLPSGTFISVPVYGTLTCERSQSSSRAPPSGFKKFDAVTISCKNTGNDLVQDCDVTLKVPSEAEVGSKASVKNSCLIYSKCTKGTSCALTTASNKVCARELFFDKQYNAEKTEHLSENQFIYAEYQEAGIVSAATIVKKGGYSINYIPYKVVKRDIFSEQTGSTISGEDCKLNSDLQELKYAIKSITPFLKSTAKLQESSILDRVTLRQRGAVIRYISNFIAVVPQFSLFEDDTKFCIDKKIYQVEEIETKIGKYKVANPQYNKVLQTVECCNTGDVPDGYKCENFKKIKLSTPSECDAFKPCPLSGWIAVNGKEMVRQKCQDKKCVNEVVKTECSFDSDCLGGQCKVDFSNPQNNKCEFNDPIDFCGNGICEQNKQENNQQCPKDCPVSPPNIPFDYNKLLIAGIILIGLLVAVIMLIKSKKGRKR